MCIRRDEKSTYDSLTSYYNRIGDRFHDCGKWDQLKKDKSSKRNPSEHIHDQHENHFHLNQISSLNPMENSLLVKEISFNPDENSSQSSLTTITHQHNGLIVTNHQH